MKPNYGYDSGILRPLPRQLYNGAWMNFVDVINLDVIFTAGVKTMWNGIECSTASRATMRIHSYTGAQPTIYITYYIYWDVYV